MGDDLGTDIALDSAGDLYMTGAYNYNITSLFHNSSDVLLVKYDSSGNLLWARSWGGSKEDVGFSDAVDSSGNIYVAGWTTSFGAGGYDALLLKFSSSGSVIWARTWGSPGFDQAWGLTLDPSGNVYVTGLYNQTSTTGKLFLLKYDPSGKLLWQRLWNGPRGAGINLVRDSSGDLYASGYYSSAASKLDALLLKFDPSGNPIWQRAWGNQTAQGIRAALDSSGNAYLTGLYYRSSTQSSFLLKFDSSGSLVWQRLWSQAYGVAVAVDSAGTVYDSGWRYRPSNASQSDVFLLTLNSTGSLLTQNLWGGSARSLNYGLALDGAGHAIVTGYTVGPPPYAVSSPSYALTTPSISALTLSYTVTNATATGTMRSEVATIPSGSETYAGKADAFLFKYGAPTVTCGQSCTAFIKTNSTITGATYNSSANAFHLMFNGTSGTHGYANVTIPKSAVLNQDASKIQVYVNHVLLPSSSLTIRMNSTYFFVYFTFTFQSPVQVDISMGITGISLPPGISLIALLSTVPILYLRRRQR